MTSFDFEAEFLSEGDPAPYAGYLFSVEETIRIMKQVNKADGILD